MSTFNRKSLGKNLEGPRGFTLGELLIVVCILSMLLLIAFPALNAFTKMAEYRKGTREITAAIRLARSRAISMAYEHRVEIDPKNMRYRLTRGNRYANSSGSSWETNIVVGWKSLPGGLSLHVNESCQESEDIVFFHANPNGTTNTRYVCILDEHGAKQFRVGIPYASTGRVKVQKWSNLMNSWK